MLTRFVSLFPKISLAIICFLALFVSSTQASEQLQAGNIQVLAPVIVGVDDSFPIFYKTTPNQPITLSNRIKLVWLDSKSSSVDKLDGEEKVAEADKRTCLLEKVGMCNIFLDFEDVSGRSIQKSVSVLVVSSDEAAIWKGNQQWNIPEGKIVFSNEDSSTTDLTFAMGVFRKLKPQPNAEDQWARIECWNTLASILKSQWLPPMEAINAFVDISRPTLTTVGYSTYSVGDVRIATRTELGKQTWIYLQAGSNLRRFSTSEKRADFFSTSSLSKKHNPYLSRIFERKRQSSSETPTDEIDVLLVHVTDKEAINLRYPRY